MRYALLLLLSSSFFISCKVSDKEIDPEGYELIFDGQTLNNWKGDSVYWKAENGCMVGEVTPATILKRNTFIIWQGGETKEFELKLEYRISEDGNSGINYRSELIDTLPFALRGYQFDIDGHNNYTGQNYEERKRTTLAYHGQKVIVSASQTGLLQDNIKNNAWQCFKEVETIANPDSINMHIRQRDWNECHLVVKGNRMIHYINDILVSDVTDNDTINRTSSGKLGVQVHVGPPMKVEFRHIRIKEIK